MRDQYMRCGEGFLICYSVTDRHSFQEALEYKKLIQKVRASEDTPLVLVGNKFDLHMQRKVTTDEGKYLYNLILDTQIILRLKMFAIFDMLNILLFLFVKLRNYFYNNKYLNKLTSYRLECDTCHYFQCCIHCLSIRTIPTFTHLLQLSCA